MDEILALLAENPSEALARLKASQVDRLELDNLHNEYNEMDRTIRDTQVGIIQKPKILGNGKVVPKVNIAIPFQNKIVNTATAFEVGEPPSLIPDEQNDLTDEVLRLWKVNRLDAILQKTKKLQKSEMQCAIAFYIKNSDNSQREIKARILENKNGNMYPYFDGQGDMIFFLWEFTVNVKGKSVKYAWVYDKDFIHYLGPNEAGSGLVLTEKKPHGFKKIPIVYLYQEKPEWYMVQQMIDRLEVAMSKAGDANDYTGHPIMKVIGEVTGMPDKNEEGKAILLPLKYNEETDKMEHGDVQFLTYDQAPEAVRMEMDRLEKYIYSMTSTPDISFENLKGMGAISGVAIKLMFLDAILKAKMNEGENRTIIERINNVLIAGTVNTVNTKLSKFVNNTFINVQFNSVIPDDLSNSVETLAKAVDGKFMSRKKAVEMLNLADDYDVEMEQIEKEQQIKPE